MSTYVSVLMAVQVYIVLIVEDTFEGEQGLTSACFFLLVVVTALFFCLPLLHIPPNANSPYPQLAISRIARKGLQRQWPTLHWPNHSVDEFEEGSGDPDEFERVLQEDFNYDEERAQNAFNSRLFSKPRLRH